MIGRRADVRSHPVCGEQTQQNAFPAEWNDKTVRIAVLRRAPGGDARKDLRDHTFPGKLCGKIVLLLLIAGIDGVAGRMPEKQIVECTAVMRVMAFHLRLRVKHQLQAHLPAYVMNHGIQAAVLIRTECFPLLEKLLVNFLRIRETGQFPFLLKGAAAAFAEAVGTFSGNAVPRKPDLLLPVQKNSFHSRLQRNRVTESFFRHGGEKGLSFRRVQHTGRTVHRPVPGIGPPFRLRSRGKIDGLFRRIRGQLRKAAIPGGSASQIHRMQGEIMRRPCEAVNSGAVAVFNQTPGICLPSFHVDGAERLIDTDLLFLKNQGVKHFKGKCGKREKRNRRIGLQPETLRLFSADGRKEFYGNPLRNLDKIPRNDPAEQNGRFRLRRNLCGHFQRNHALRFLSVGAPRL